MLRTCCTRRGWSAGCFTVVIENLRRDPALIYRQRLVNSRLFGVDLGHNFFFEPLEVIESLRDRDVRERGPQERHGQSRFFVSFKHVRDLVGGSCQ